MPPAPTRLSAAIRSAAPAFICSATLPTRLNWSATNTSLHRAGCGRSPARVRRPMRRRSQTRPTRLGRTTLTVRRDYREVLPLLRHRHDPDQSGGERDPRAGSAMCKLTVDARLQTSPRRCDPVHVCAAIRPGRKAAAIVIDPDTGDLLAAASYPFPALTRYQNGEEDDGLTRCAARSRAGQRSVSARLATSEPATAAAALRRTSA